MHHADKKLSTDAIYTVVRTLTLSSVVFTLALYIICVCELRG